MNLSDIRFYLLIGLRRLPIIVACALIAGLIGLWFAMTLEPVYRATAKVLLESPRIPAEMARTTVSGSAIEELQVIEQEIKTRDHLLGLNKRFALYNEVESEDDIVDDLRGRIHFERLPLGDGTMGESVALFAISFDSYEPQLSTEVSNFLVSYLMSKNTQSRTGRAGEAMQFFQKEVARLGAEVAEVERRILDLKTANMNSLPESLEFRRAQQADVQERIAGMDREAAALRNRRLSILRLKELGVVNTDPSLMSPEQRTLDELNRALTVQLSLFSEASPKVAALRSQIRALKEQIDQQDKASRTSGTESLASSSLAEVDDRLRDITQEKAFANAKLAALTESIDATPATESKLSEFERSRANILNQYNAAVAKLAEATTAERIEASSKASRFTVVEAALPPQYPTRSNRRLLVLAATAVGAGLGAALSLLLELMNGAMRRPLDVVRALDMQPLVTIPYLDLPGQSEGAGRRFIRWIGRPAGALAIFLIALLVPSPGYQRSIKGAGQADMPDVAGIKDLSWRK